FLKNARKLLESAWLAKKAISPCANSLNNRRLLPRAPLSVTSLRERGNRFPSHSHHQRLSTFQHSSLAWPRRQSIPAADRFRFCGLSIFILLPIGHSPRGGRE